MKLSYRADIDGIRAVAVIAVILFHAMPNLYSGGYLGVDIFFVISGFLITSIILKEETFSYKDFYYRRIKRILPALITVLMVTWLAGWFLFFPQEYKQLCRHILTGLGFSSNVQLWSEIGYFDNAHQTKPLLHLWSLGIEEQFYIFWPALLLLWKRKAVFIIGPISLICYYCIFPDKTSFYMIFTRAWELLIGCSIAFYSHKKMPNYASYIGLLSILLAIIIKSNLLVTLATALIIFSPGNKFLENKIIVRIGLISYPLYLWHWPIMSFLFILNLEKYIPLAIPISIILAELTYRFIERPKSIKPILIAIPVFILFVLFIPGRQKDIEYRDDWQPFKGYTNKIENGIRVYRNKIDTDTKVLFWGDSHMQQYAPRIREISKKAVVFSYMGGITPNDFYQEGYDQNLVKKFRTESKKIALSDEVETVVIGAWWNQCWLKSLPSLEKLLIELKDKEVFLVLDNPCGKEFTMDNLVSRYSGKKKGYSIKQNPNQKQLRDKMIALAQKLNVQVVDPTEHFVKDGYCKALYDNGKPIYKDAGGHLNSSYVRDYANYIDVVVN